MFISSTRTRSILPKYFPLRSCSSILEDNNCSHSCSRLLKILKLNNSTSSSNSSSTTTNNSPPADSHWGEWRSWQIHSYSSSSLGGELQLSTSRLPPIRSPTDVLIQVLSASVNPIDVAMTKGYGAETLNLLRSLCPPEGGSGPFGLPSLKQLPLPFLGSAHTHIEFPLTLGRDFSGRIVQMGYEAKGQHSLSVGDDVFGVVGVQRQGSHANYVVASVDTIRRKPKSISFLEAAAIPYVGLTTWAALKVTGGFTNLAGKRFLLLGGSGGVGTFAVQYLKSQGAHVTTTCSSDATSLMISLGADFVIDYKVQHLLDMIKHYAPYDCVLDLSGPSNSKKALETIQYLKAGTGQYITLSPPFLSNMDRFRLLGGAAKNVGDLLSSNYQTWTKGQAITKWAFFIPNGNPLQHLAELLESNQIRPVIHQSYKFEEAKSAYKAVEEGHLRGKIILDMQ